MASALIAFEGVLRNGDKAIPEGRRLLAALAGIYRVIVALDDSEVEAFNYWAKMEGVTQHEEVLAGNLPAALRGQDARLAQVEFLRGRGEHLALVIDGNPAHVRAAYEHGIAGLLFTEPGRTRPEWSPDWDETPVPWADLVADIERQHLAQASDG